jgi:hypothetical protein
MFRAEGNEIAARGINPSGAKNPRALRSGRPLAFHLTGGDVADVTVAAPLLGQCAPSAWLIGNKGYEADFPKHP